MKKIFAFLITAGVLGLSSCSGDNDPSTPNLPGSNDKPVFLVIDEESIDNGNEPNNFS